MGADEPQWHILTLRFAAEVDRERLSEVASPGAVIEALSLMLGLPDGADVLLDEMTLLPQWRTKAGEDRP